MLQKEQLKRILKMAIIGMPDYQKGDPFYNKYVAKVVGEEYAEYSYEERSGDENIAKAAIQYPELHDLMCELVEMVTCSNFREKTIWDEDEEHVGGAIARELALYNKANVALYAKFLSSNDLNHEVYQEQDIDEIMSKWGVCRETYPLAVVRWLAPGQHGDSFPYADVAEHIGKKGKDEAKFFMKLAVKWFDKYLDDSDNHDDVSYSRYRRKLADLLMEVIGETLEISEVEINEMLDKALDYDYDDDDIVYCDDGEGYNEDEYDYDYRFWMAKRIERAVRPDFKKPEFDKYFDDFDALYSKLETVTSAKEAKKLNKKHGERGPKISGLLSQLTFDEAYDFLAYSGKQDILWFDKMRKFW
jgi:hypothetical protein